MVKERVRMNMETKIGFHTRWRIYWAAYWILVSQYWQCRTIFRCWEDSFFFFGQRNLCRSEHTVCM